VLYLVANRRGHNRESLTGHINGWKTILNTAIIHYGYRITAAV
jgi:hypothetical protein